MVSKMSRFYSGVMEAAWLAAVCLVPIFFNIYSSRIFEPDKIALLRSLALISLAAWLLKLIDAGGKKWSNQESGKTFGSYLWHFPMLAPVAGLITVYILSTIFSVTPSISLFGSYQRLQGTYTTFSYLVLFGCMVTNMRTRDQVNRFVTTVILASLPISLYGILQHYNIDPIPWGGNVSIRIAANMGNSIFVAAYLIMVFPLTIGRIISAFKDILSEEVGNIVQTRTAKRITRATIYIFIASLEIIAIYMSGSRGPLLGLLAGSYLLLLLLAIFWKKRWLSIITVLLALFAVGFLAVFNLNSGPLEALKKSPAIGRFGRLLDPESNSALVRQYIWEGTVNLVGVHDPLKFPDGSEDKFNLLRPIIGYGPESMYVAYNQFYQPDLGQVEKRNASPDRSHNETWDSIVITGISGLLIYLSVFGSIFYYCLKWQGLVRSVRQKYFYLLCLIGGGVIGSALLIYLKGVEFFGIGLPLGMIVGVVIYLTVYALTITNRDDNAPHRFSDTLLMIVIFAALVGHFVEINFGIAIVATRTLFWTLSALLIVIGYILPQLDNGTEENIHGDVINELPVNPVERKTGKRTSVKSNRRIDRNKRPLIGDYPDWVRTGLISAFIVGIILATLGFTYITNSNQTTSVFSILIDSFTRLRNQSNATSLGILFLVIVTWLVGVLLFSAERHDESGNENNFSYLTLVAVGSIIVGLVFWILHSVSLAVLAGFTPANQNDVVTQVNNIGSLLTKYFLYIFIFIILAAFLLPERWSQRGRSSSSLNIIFTSVAMILLFIIVNISNLKVIHADVTFKMAEPFSKSDQWQVATFLYKRALKLAPREDHYYLFLGRSYLEQAKVTDVQSDQESLVLQAEKDLKVAQAINPLNTDHTANLARLFSWWASKATTTSVLQERGEKASAYYATAVTLSPNNSTLWDEWAVLFMQVLGQNHEALLRLEHARALDERYSFTQGLLGDYYLRIANSSNDNNSKIDALSAAIDSYQTAANLAKKTEATNKATYLVSMGSTALVLADLDAGSGARSRLQEIASFIITSLDSGVNASDMWKVQEVIAKLNMRLGDKEQAKVYATLSLTNAPQTATSRLQQLLEQINALP